MRYRWLHSANFEVALFVADVKTEAILGQLGFFNRHLAETVVLNNEAKTAAFTVRIPENLKGKPTHSTAKNVTLELISHVKF